MEEEKKLNEKAEPVKACREKKNSKRLLKKKNQRRKAKKLI